MYKVVILLASVASCLGQSVQSGTCFPASKIVVQNFNTNQVFWYHFFSLTVKVHFNTVV